MTARPGNRRQSMFKELSTPVVLVSGLSGAGHSTALKQLEDLGYEAVDNLPMRLLPRLVGETGDAPPARPLAIGVDIRTRDFAADDLARAVSALRGRVDLTTKLLFLDCDTETLLRRFTETRRRHPLAGDRPVRDGIDRERPLIAPLRRAADVVIDTSALSLWELKQTLTGHFALDKSPGLAVFVVSFSYRSGLPRDADLVFDARFLRNPHYCEELRPLTGKDPGVADYVAADPAYQPFLAALTGMLEGLLPRFEAEGKSYLTIAVGCTGGRHRSVCLVEALAEWLRAHHWQTTVRHQDIPR